LTTFAVKSTAAKLHLTILPTPARCNQNKGSDIATFIDEETDQLVRFFNPRKDDWHEHFQVNDGEILPLSSIGRATIRILGLNQTERIILRKMLIEIGFYPSN
jgi:hypothetical protein